MTDRRSAEPPRRAALAPGLLGAVALVAGIALLDSDGFTVIRYLVSILALITAWFTVEARAWWWAVPLVAIAVLWNPVFPFPFSGDGWLGAQYVGVLVFALAGVFTRSRPRPA